MSILFVIEILLANKMYSYNPEVKISECKMALIKRKV